MLRLDQVSFKHNLGDKRSYDLVLAARFFVAFLAGAFFAVVFFAAAFFFVDFLAALTFFVAAFFFEPDDFFFAFPKARSQLSLYCRDAPVLRTVMVVILSFSETGLTLQVRTKHSYPTYCKWSRHQFVRLLSVRTGKDQRDRSNFAGFYCMSFL